jgi:hypothetical protein
MICRYMCLLASMCCVRACGAAISIRLPAARKNWGCKPKPRKFYNAFNISLLIRIQTLNPARNLRTLRTPLWPTAVNGPNRHGRQSSFHDPVSAFFDRGSDLKPALPDAAAEPGDLSRARYRLFFSA